MGIKLWFDYLENLDRATEVRFTWPTLVRAARSDAVPQNLGCGRRRKAIARALDQA